MMEATIIVQNLRCGGCVNTITAKLMDFKNINNVSIDVETSKIQFNYLNEADLLLVKDKLKTLGYPEINDKNSMLYKAKSIVSCATGKLK